MCCHFPFTYITFLLKHLMNNTLTVTIVRIWKNANKHVTIYYNFIFHLVVGVIVTPICCNNTGSKAKFVQMNPHEQCIT